MPNLGNTYFTIFGSRTEYHVYIMGPPKMPTPN